MALNLPAAERERLRAAVRPLQEGGFPVRWVEPVGWHVTLKFLGEVAEKRAEEVGEAVAGSAARVGAFEIELNGVGGFPTLRRPRVVWMGVEAGPEIELLYEELEGNFERLGFERESRGFHPHVTLGRAERGAGASQWRGIEEIAGSVDYRARLRVETVDLMRSRLRPTGAQYELVRAARLARGGGAGGGARGPA